MINNNNNNNNNNNDNNNNNNIFSINLLSDFSISLLILTKMQNIFFFLSLQNYLKFKKIGITAIIIIIIVMKLINKSTNRERTKKKFVCN